MVCETCKRGVHQKCRGETWCDCQHRDAFLARFGIPVEQLEQLPRHDPTCLIGKPHLTCTCGVYGRRFVGTEAANAQIEALTELTAQLQEMEPKPARGHQCSRECSHGDGPAL